MFEKLLAVNARQEEKKCVDGVPLSRVVGAFSVLQL